ncbi:MAG: hypothetical protein NTV11_15145 [Rhodocyclales bacterium]|nr:hypothetical protein [Rhodocyclales bacterium]
MRYMKHVLAALLLLPCLAGVSLAEERHHRDGRAQWHGEIGRFHEHDIERWRGGRWHHGRHEGRYGWWWIVGSVWYFYPARVDTYPDPYQPPVVAPVIVAPPAPAPAQYWYYCANPAGYYPYVAQCTVNWQRVPATAPPR